MRTTLLTRLKPEFRIGLEKKQHEYHVFVDKLFQSLDTEVFYSDLTINQVCSIFLFSDISGASRTDFNWKFGEDIFELENDVS